MQRKIRFSGLTKALEGERIWILPVAVLIGLQAIFALSVRAIVGEPASPPLGYYFIGNLSFMGAAAAIYVIGTLSRISLKRDELSASSVVEALTSNPKRLVAAFVGIQLFTLAAGLMTWSKAMMPYAVGFRYDRWLADADKVMFGSDPWIFLQWLMPLLEPIYALWFAMMMITFLVVLVQRPSDHRSAAIIAFFLAWAIGGTLAPYLMPAAGPVFYERIGLGPRFAEMPITALYRFESDYLWAAYQSKQAGIAAGISAMPSMHVAMSAWMAFALRPLSRTAFALSLLFLTAIWVGSVATGWHYALDGLAGVAVAAGCWWVAWQICRDGFARGLDAADRRAPRPDPA